MSKMELDKRAAIQKIGIKKRFPQLPNDIIESTWSGVVSRSRNSSQIFEKLDDNVFVAGCYNGSGIGVGTLFGEQIAIKAANETSEEIKIIEKKKKPKWLPPTFFLDIGVKTRLMYERLRSRSDI
jgi:glycine/D-amino acid oxidase-like deaminating enzyme